MKAKIGLINGIYQQIVQENIIQFIDLKLKCVCTTKLKLKLKLNTYKQFV